MISGVAVGDGGGVSVAVGTSVGKKNVGVGAGSVGLEVGVGKFSTLTHAEELMVNIINASRIFIVGQCWFIWLIVTAFGWLAQKIRPKKCLKFSREDLDARQSN